MAKLTPKQQRFVEEYLVDFNATRAAKSAGYSAKTAKQQASRMLTNVDVGQAINAGRERLAAKAEISAEMVLAEISAVAFESMGRFVTVGEDGLVGLDFSLMQPEDLKAVSEITQDTVKVADGVEVVRTKFKLHSKMAALGKLGEHYGLFTKKLELSGSVGLNDMLEEISGTSRGLPENKG